MSYARLMQFALVGAVFCSGSIALEREGVEFKVFQFPPDALPRIDGDLDDWESVPDSYVVGTDELWEDSGKHDAADPENLDIKVRVGWAKGLNKLYFAYEAYDDYWDFSLPGLKNDTFEVVVDADLSGGPLIDRFRENSEVVSESRAWWKVHGAHAQNYHIFTPAKDKDWTMLWGPAQWVKDLPYANVAYQYDFEPGESGKLVLEFWITPFDYAGAEGPERAVPSVLEENELIGLCWAIIDYDDVDSERNNGFWNLSRSHTMYGKANELVAFRLMPREDGEAKQLQADWSFKTIDYDSRIVAFRDQSTGEGIAKWHWDFGDGETSNEQHPIHEYKEPAYYVVSLTVAGDDGESKFSRVWDVTFK